LGGYGWLDHVGVADRDLALIVEEGDHRPIILYLLVSPRVLHVLLLVAKEGGCDSVMSMLQMALLLVAREEAPAEEAGAHLAGVLLVVLLNLANEHPEVIRVEVHIPNGLLQLPHRAVLLPALLVIHCSPQSNPI